MNKFKLNSHRGSDTKCCRWSL